MKWFDDTWFFNDEDRRRIFGLFIQRKSHRQNRGSEKEGILTIFHRQTSKGSLRTGWTTKFNSNHSIVKFWFCNFHLRVGLSIVLALLSFLTSLSLPKRSSDLHYLCPEWGYRVCSLVDVNMFFFICLVSCQNREKKIKECFRERYTCKGWELAPT